MKPLILYHANCADGFGAAFAAWKSLGNDAEYVAIAYDKFVFNEETGLLAVGDTVYPTQNRELYILDFSFNSYIMKSLFEKCAKVVWLDHHKTAFESWRGKYEKGMIYTDVDKHNKDINIYLNDNKSGALLAWEYFHPTTPVPLLIKHIDDYDRWVFALGGTKDFNKTLWSYPKWSFEQWDDILKLCNSPVGYKAWLDEGAAILRAHSQNVLAVIASSKQPCTITYWEHAHVDNPHEDNKAMTSAREVGLVGLAANCPKHLASDAGHHLANESKTFGLCWFQKSDSMVEVSLRSNGLYDVAAIATKFGGGGHMNAAGFKVTMDQLQRWFYPNRRIL